jgi:hypothetical protein
MQLNVMVTWVAFEVVANGEHSIGKPKHAELSGAFPCKQQVLAVLVLEKQPCQ